MWRMSEDYDLDRKGAERAYRPDILEKELKIHAEIDRRIDKAINHLVTIKEYKKHYGANTIEVKTVEAKALIGLPSKPTRDSGEI